VTPISGFAGPPVRRIVGHGDGGFAVLALTHCGNTMTDSLHVYGSQGEELWKVKQGNSREPGTLFSPTDIAVPPDGTLLVLQRSPYTVQRFDLEGRYQEMIDLESAWHCPPGYLTDIVPDGSDGFVIHDQRGTSALVWMRLDGSITKELPASRFPDGRTFFPSRFAMGADGQLWTCDGHSLLRLDENGIVDRVLGVTPSGRRLDDTSAVQLQGNRIYVRSLRSSAVHVFDHSGRHLHVCQPRPDEVPDITQRDHFTVTGNGQVYIGPLKEGGYLHFASDGAHLGSVEASGDRQGAWHFASDGSLWVVDQYEVRLISPSGEVRRIRRRPDNDWLGWIKAASVAPNGGLAVLDDRNHGNTVVSLYSVGGAPLSCFEAAATLGPVLYLAYGCDLVLLGAERGIIAYDLTGKPQWRFQPSADHPGSFWQPMLGQDKLLALYAFGGGTLLRYRLP
jgi:hypothetical protein